MISAAKSAVPPLYDPNWIKYNNCLEKKWTMENRDHLPDVWLTLLAAMESDKVIDILEHLFCTRLMADPNRRGAGLHYMMPGGFLQTHIDYDLHPSGMERYCNLILYLDDAGSENGGATEFCNGMGVCKCYHVPKAGEGVLWKCGDDTFHGVGRVKNDSPPRVSAACYFLAPPRYGLKRPRALFIPPR